MEKEPIPYTQSLSSLTTQKVHIRVNNFKIIEGDRFYRLEWTDPMTHSVRFKWESINNLHSFFDLIQTYEEEERDQVRDTE